MIVMSTGTQVSRVKVGPRYFAAVVIGDLRSPIIDENGGLVAFEDFLYERNRPRRPAKTKGSVSGTDVRARERRIDGCSARLYRRNGVPTAIIYGCCGGEGPRDFRRDKRDKCDVVDNCWKRHRKTRWRRTCSGCILPSDLRN